MHRVNIRSFDLNLLAVFVTLWDTRSVTRASDRLALTQPAVSHALRRLRQALDDELFVSSKGGLVPTPRSEALIGPIREALATLQSALVEETPFDPLVAQREFNIAAGDLFEYSQLPQLVEHVRQHAPGVVLRVSAVPEGELSCQQLESGELDVVIGSQPLKGAEIQNETLMEISISTLISKREGIRKRRFPLALYLERPHVVIRTPERQFTVVDVALAQRGLQRKIGAVVQNFMAMPMIAERSGYICNVPDSMAGMFAELFDLSVHLPPIDFDASPLLISWHRRFNADPAHIWFRELLRSMVL